MCCGSDWILTWFRNTVASRPTCVEIKKYWQYKRTKKKLSPSPQSVFMALMTSVELCEKFHQEKESCINSSEMWYKDTETCQLAWSVTGWWKPLRSLPSLKYPISASATSPDSLRRDRWKLLRNCWGQFHCLFRKWKKSRKKKKKQRGSQCNREQGTVYFLESFVDTLAVWLCGRILTEVISPGFPDGEYYCLYWSPDFSSAVTMRLAFMALVKCLDCWLVCHKIHPYPILFHKCHLYSLNFSSSVIIRSTFYGLNTKYLWFPIPPTSAMEC